MAIRKLKHILDNQPKRSRDAIKNIALSLGTKGLSVAATLLIVPMTISYVNPTQYGIWLTVSQIIGWIAFFDLGLGNGFRNKFAEAKANGNIELAGQYLSTTYFAITCISILVLLVALFINHFLDWSMLLKLDSRYGPELKRVFGVLCIFFCLNLVASIFNMLLTADQKPGYASAITCAGQIFSLVSIFILTKVSVGSLFNLALFFAGVPCTVLLLSSIISFCFTRYKAIRPSIKAIRLELIKDILSLGLKFFFIYICIIAIFQVSNIVLSREIGPDAVTQYNIAYKYFNMLYSIMLIIITPFWSAFTDAYAKSDKEWMKSTTKKLERMCGLSILCGIIMLLVSPLFYRLWVGDKVSVSFILSTGILSYVLAQTIGNAYMYIINGIGTIRIQLAIYFASALMAWPLMTLCCRLFGVTGIVLVPTAVFLVQALFSKIQITKLLSDKATGWWCK